VERLVALGQQHGAISCVKECALSALRVLVLGLRAGKVCAISALCAISRRIELEGDGTTSFLQPFDDGLPPRRAGVRSCCGAKLSKTCQSQEDTHWAHPCSLRNHLLTLRAPAVGEGIQSGKSGKSVLFNNEQLTKAEKGCSRKRGKRS
jgi:hypothetical protein